MKTLKRIFKPQYFLTILIVLVVGVSITYSFDISFKKEPRKKIEKSIKNLEDQFTSTNDDFIPCINHKKLKDTIIREGSFSTLLNIDLSDNLNENNYKIKRDFKRDYTSKKSQSNISISKNNEKPLSINSKLMYNSAYLDLNSSYNKTLGIDLKNFGEKLYNSNLLDEDIKNNMNKKEVLEMKNTKINLFVYPGTLGELKDYYLSFISYNLDGILNSKNIEILPANKDIKNLSQDNTIENYRVKISYFDFKYLLLSSLNSFENLLSIYNSNYNINLDLELIHTKLRDLSERILDEFQEKGTLYANFYINKDNELLYLLVTKNDNLENSKEEEVLKLSLLGTKNTTDNINLLVYDIKDRKIEFNRNLDITNINTLTNTLLINDMEFLKTSANYNQKNKNLEYNMISTNKYQENKIVNVKGFFSEIEKPYFKYEIDNFKYISNTKDLDIKGDVLVQLKKPVITAPEKNVIDIFSLDRKEFEDIKENIINVVNNYIPIENVKMRLPSWNIFTHDYIKF